MLSRLMHIEAVRRYDHRLGGHPEWALTCEDKCDTCSFESPRMAGASRANRTRSAATMTRCRLPVTTVGDHRTAALREPSRLTLKRLIERPQIDLLRPGASTLLMQ